MQILILGGVTGDGGASRLWLDGGQSIIVKSSLLPGERTFYEHHAKLVRCAGARLLRA